MWKPTFMAQTQSENPKWVHGEYYTDCNQNLHYISNSEGKVYRDTFQIDKTTLSMCSNVPDSEGNLIYENHILQFDYTKSKNGSKLGVCGRAKVVFSRGCFGVLWGWKKEFIPLFGFCNTRITIIGNVFDNPYLLEKSQGVIV